MKLRCIVIVGLGLMGASLAAAVRRKYPGCKVIGISRNAKALRQAKQKKIIHESYRSIASIGNCDLVVLCTPVDIIPAMLHQLEEKLTRRTIVTDVGSTKGELQSFAEKRKWKKVSFVGSHPLVGSEERGFDAMRSHLYDDGTVFVVRGKKTNAADLKAVVSFWKKISKKVVLETAKRHDEIVAEISHLPHLAALCLVNSVTNASLRHAASGFRDTTRIALGDESIWVPIMLSNKESMKKVLAGYERSLKKFKKELVEGDSKALKRLINQAKSRRSNM